jgi:HAE1 family hydrophobic/amphiphilic exporter-1
MSFRGGPITSEKGRAISQMMTEQKSLSAQARRIFGETIPRGITYFRRGFFPNMKGVCTMKKIRLFGTRLFAVSLMVWLATPLALAQSAERTIVAKANQDQNQTPPPSTGQQREPLFGRVQPVMEPRVGVDPNQIWNLSLHDAILKALETNNQIQIERTNILASEQSLKAAHGAYDILVGATLNAPTSKPPSNQVQFTGDDLDGDGNPDPVDTDGDGFPDNADLVSTTSRRINSNITVQQLLPLPTGTSWRFLIDSSRFNQDTSIVNFGGFTFSGGFTFLPTYSSNVTFEITQPLFKNFRIDQQRRQIRLSKKALDLSDSTFRQRVIDIITQVQRAYWDLVFTIRSVEVQQQALDLAKTNLANNRKQVEAGTLAPIELAQSEAQVQQSQQSLITAIGNVTLAENALKMLILGDPNAVEWKANVAPTESIDILPPAIDLESALKLAQSNRPELEQLRLRKEQNEIDVKYYANQLWPEVNLTASYTLNGFAGRPTQVFNEDTGEFERRPVPERFVGGPWTAFKNAFSNDFRGYAFGVSFNFPIRNRTAEGLLGQTKATARSLNFQEQQLVQSIAVEVRNALQAVETARQTIEAARAERKNREVQLDGEQKKFEAGLSSTFLVLQFQNFLSNARLQELQALVNYNKAIADLQRVISTTLSAHNVEITPQK